MPQLIRIFRNSSSALHLLPQLGVRCIDSSLCLFPQLGVRYLHGSLHSFLQL